MREEGSPCRSARMRAAGTADGRQRLTLDRSQRFGRHGSRRNRLDRLLHGHGRGRDRAPPPADRHIRSRGRTNRLQAPEPHTRQRQTARTWRLIVTSISVQLVKWQQSRPCQAKPVAEKPERDSLFRRDDRVLRMRGRLRPRQTVRATIIFLISAMALAGLRPFGQVLAQFMMVWQR